MVDASRLPEALKRWGDKPPLLSRRGHRAPCSLRCLPTPDPPALNYDATREVDPTHFEEIEVLYALIPNEMKTAMHPLLLNPDLTTPHLTTYADPILEDTLVDIETVKRM